MSERKGGVHTSSSSESILPSISRTETDSPNQSSWYDLNRTPGSEKVSFSLLGTQVMSAPSSMMKGGVTLLMLFLVISLTLRNLPVGSSIRSENNT